jgi:competence protein ComEC
VQFEWLHPGTGPYRKDNDSSCVLRIQAGDHVALLSADIEGTAEAEMLASRPPGPVDVLVAPHHGSRTSSSPDFVQATHPRWVVYAVGYRNRWKFPVASVVERWRKAGAVDRATSSSGALTFELQPGRPLTDPVEWRRQQARLWRDP